MNTLTFEETQVQQSEQRVLRAMKHDIVVQINELHLLVTGESMSSKDADALYALDHSKLEMMLAINSQQAKRVEY